MARQESAIFTNLIMLYDEEGRILVEDRKDPNWPGLCFPGGHVEPGEPFLDAAKREVLEETGLTAENLKLCGVKQFPHRSGARYVVFLYKTKDYSGHLHASDEGEVFWVSKSDLKKYRLCDDFEEIIRVMESDSLNEFVYHVQEDQWKLKLL